MTLEQKLKKIDEILNKFDNEDFELEKFLKEYEIGIQLIHECRETINKAELKIKEINEKFK